MNDPAYHFQARIERRGIQRCVEVPGRISQALGERGPIPVRGQVHGIRFQSTLTPRGDGLHRLFIHSRIYKQLGVDSGDLVEVRLERDPDPEAKVPEELARALDAHPESKQNFQRLTAARRREVIGYLQAARRPETRARRVDEIVARLLTDLRPRSPPLLD